MPILDAAQSSQNDTNELQGIPKIVTTDDVIDSGVQTEISTGRSVHDSSITFSDSEDEPLTKKVKRSPKTNKLLSKL